jgi:hypothetical protein
MPAPSTPYYTTVRNTSGAARHFGYLGSYGVRLAAGADYAEMGDLVAKLAKDKKQFDSFAADLLANRIEVLSTPPQVAYDNVLTQVRFIGTSNGSPVSTPPTYGSYAGPGPNPV